MDSIQETFEKHLPKLEAAFNQFPWENESAYVHYLAQTFFYVKHSTELLSVATKHAKTKPLSNHLIRHRKEETGHDKWALGDVQTLGYDISSFQMLEETKNVYESIYSEIEKIGPAGVMGYAMSLEGVSARALPSICIKLEKLYGKKAIAFMQGHSDADPHHVKDGLKAADLLDESGKQAWKRVFIESIDRYVKYLNRIEAVAKSIGLPPKKSLPKAA